MKEIKLLLKEHKKCSKKAEKFRIRRDELLDKIRKLCDHPKTREESDHFPGNYHDKAVTSVTIFCKVCGKLLKTEDHEHSWYG